MLDQTPARPYASVRDFRTRVFADVTLPSGLLVKIRYVQSIDMMSAWDLPMPSSAGRETDAGEAPDNDNNADTIRRGLAWRDSSILHGCVWPPIVPRGAGTDEALGLDELSNADYEALSQAILRHSGMAPEVAATVEAFRQDTERPDRGATGGEVPRPAASGVTDDPSGTLPQSPLAALDTTDGPRPSPPPQARTAEQPSLLAQFEAVLGRGNGDENGSSMTQEEG